MTEDATKTAVIIEDDPDVRSLLDEVFRSAGFRTVLAGTGLEGVAAVAANRPVITTLDINLPGIDGFEAARRIRAVSGTFIIMLSALGEESDVVLGLTSGADEYLVKPFRPRELRARIEALLRRPRNPEPSPATTAGATPAASDAAPAARIPSGVAQGAAARNPSVAAAHPPAGTAGRWHAHRDISLDLDTHTVLVAQQEVDLTPTEFDLLATLLESKRRVRSKSDLALVLRGEAFGSASYVGDPDKRAIEAHMANLRRKIGDSTAVPRYIETVRGVGYRLTAHDDAVEG
ncbi:response regulator transcription factor [Microbacterium azadirachtae]|uniref:response regulator transcription factor n=1 Tax=Microbacterium azadirachtae TaxID=582680 RepID=UPI00089006BD|nr:response regulator transcription factor [Microbacterium azadirachtae]UXW85187.1 response regulator transcription factor [Microbacterium azadirachtae]SDM09522.1 DNA-binding response regulator, OmpR family, contains REC and winged-helix (wHTH) domain [Microbacterium azadirachtae]SEG34626.1 DNA-binding response regulator, OmpR family, contains REC and winged-helix (wHTH) domain [Microbacterium azadirachtae]SEG37278.1 DNA-binding response regulator, OmpR family, contains REC and winged-helix (wH